MSISDDLDFIENYRELLDTGLMKVKISREQVCEIVVADLAAKYTACKTRKDDFFSSFEKVLRFFSKR